MLVVSMNFTSVLVSAILAFLIVYANRFLIRRRKKELVIYLLLGMPKGRVSFVLAMETVLIGAFALAVGLVVGILLSQGLSVLVASMFQVELTVCLLYTSAGAIASIAFDIAVPVVDGNVLRVTARMAGSLEQIDSAAYRSKTRKILEQIIPHEAPGDFNQALMELGATVCLPNGEPLCRHCPVQGICVAKKRGLTAQIPVRAPKKEKRQEQRTVLLLWRRGKIAPVSYTHLIFWGYHF